MTEYVRTSRRHSWHIVRNWTRVLGRAVALCGRTVMAEMAVENAAPPLDQKGCETCARIALRNTETVA